MSKYTSPVYKVGQAVIERIGEGDHATEHPTTIDAVSKGVAYTETANDYDALTGMRLDRTESYRSIRDTKKRPTGEDE